MCRNDGRSCKHPCLPSQANKNKRLDESLTSRREQIAWRRHDILDRRCRRNLVGGLSRRCERAGELRSDTSRTGAHRLLPWPKSVLSWTIGPCRWEGARAIRRRVVSGNYRNKPSKTETTPATIKTQTIPAGDWKTSIIAPSFDLISPNPRQPQSRRPLKSVVRRSIERSFGDFD